MTVVVYSCFAKTTNRERDEISMEEKKWSQNRYVILLLITGAVYFFLKYISPLITPVIIAIMFLTLCYPTFDDIQKKTRIKKQYMASAFLLIICTVLIVLVWKGGAFVIQKFPDWINGMDETQQRIYGMIQDCCDDIGDFLGIDTMDFADNMLAQINVFVSNFRVKVMPNLLEQSWVFVRHILSIIGVLAVTMIATVLLAKDYDAILSWTGANAGSRMILEVILKVIGYVSTFLKAQVLIMLSIGTVCVTILLLSGIKNGLLFGILAGVLDALPFIGTGIVLLPLGFWQLLQGYYWKALLCLIAYIVCVIVREVMEPKLIGNRVGVYPFAILIAIYAGIKLFGLWGIVKGPIGLVMIQQAFLVYARYVDGKNQMNYDDKENTDKKEDEE